MTYLFRHYKTEIHIIGEMRWKGSVLNKIKGTTMELNVVLKGSNCTLRHELSFTIIVLSHSLTTNNTKRISTPTST